MVSLTLQCIMTLLFLCHKLEFGVWATYSSLLFGLLSCRTRSGQNCEVDISANLHTPWSTDGSSLTFLQPSLPRGLSPSQGPL